MSLFKKLGNAAKRLARNKILLGALNTATGGTSGKVLSVGKSIGAKIHGNRLMKRQQKAVAHAVEKLSKIPRPDFVNTPGDRTTDFINQRARTTTKSSRKAPSSRKRKANGSAAAERRRQDAAERAYKRDGAKARKNWEDTEPRFNSDGSKNPRYKAKKKAKRTSTTKRAAPTGGLDLKKISAKWKAAGKPGKWLDFVKANR